MHDSNNSNSFESESCISCSEISLEQEINNQDIPPVEENTQEQLTLPERVIKNIFCCLASAFEHNTQEYTMHQGNMIELLDR